MVEIGGRTKGVHGGKVGSGCGAHGSGGERQEEALNMMRKKREGTGLMKGERKHSKTDQL